MKKSILLAVLLSLVVSSCTYEQKERQNWRELFYDDGYGYLWNLTYFPIYGDVQKVTVFKDCSFKNFLDEKSSPDGRIVASVWFDEYGDVVESEMEYYERDGWEDGFFERKRYVYDQHRRLLVVNGDDSSEHYEYDKGGKLVSKREVREFFTSTDRYDYDSHGRVIEERRYSAVTGEFVARTCWGYDDNGRVFESADYNSDGRRIRQFLYRYKYWLGVLVKEEREEVSCNGEKYNKSREYDWRGRLKCPEGCRCKYDKHGNMIAKADFNYGDTVVYRYKIVYR